MSVPEQDGKPSAALWEQDIPAKVLKKGCWLAVGRYLETVHTKKKRKKVGEMRGLWVQLMMSKTMLVLVARIMMATMMSCYCWHFKHTFVITSTVIVLILLIVSIVVVVAGW